MKRILLALVIVLGIAASALADPKIFVPEPYFDFGNVPQKSSIKHDYVIKNIGTDTLRITRVKPGWGCTTAPIKKKVLAPGDSTVVEMTFNSRTYRTKIKKYATIYSNDPQKPTMKIHLEVKAGVRPDSTLNFSYSPYSVKLDKDKKKGEIEFFADSQSDMIIQQISPDVYGLDIDIKKDKIKAGKKGKIKFKWKNPVEIENIEKSITFAINDTTRISIPVFIAGTDPTPPAVKKAKQKKAAQSKQNLQKSRTGARKALSKPGKVTPVPRKAKPVVVKPVPETIESENTTETGDNN
jgi:hypothetical protein